MLSNILISRSNLEYFFDKLKIAKVILLHKDGKTDMINNYRPILSSLSKIYEKLVNNGLNNFLNK